MRDGWEHPFEAEIDFLDIENQITFIKTGEHNFDDLTATIKVLDQHDCNVIDYKITTSVTCSTGYVSGDGQWTHSYTECLAYSGNDPQMVDIELAIREAVEQYCS